RADSAACGIVARGRCRVGEGFERLAHEPRRDRTGALGRELMLEFLGRLQHHSQFFNLFNYITFRTGGAIVTAIIIAFAIGGPFIKWLRKKQGKGQPIRTDGPEGHLLTKKGTPTMGGLIILISLGIASLLWSDLRNPYVWSVLAVTLGFGTIGFIDDFSK